MPSGSFKKPKGGAEKDAGRVLKKASKERGKKRGGLGAFFFGFKNLFKKLGGFFWRKSKGLQARRPHRSFQKTRRRDYERSLKMPGYVAFTKYVFSVIWKNKKTFLALMAFMALASVILVGMMSQDMYESLQDALEETSENVAGGDFGQVGKSGLLLLSIATTGGLNQAPSESQQIFNVIIFLIVWMVVVWILRNYLAGNKVRMRDGLYNAMGPLVGTVLVLVFLLIQLIPVAIVAFVYSMALGTQFLENIFAAAVFWPLAILLLLLSLYWGVGTILALVVVTIPGMYPMEAIKMAGDLIIGRRVRVILRVLWALLVLAVCWAVIMIPIILLEGWLKVSFEFLAGVPIVPVALLIISVMSVVYLASYVYLFYRRIVDDNASPA